jgi:hypothetical protein
LNVYVGKVYKKEQIVKLSVLKQITIYSFVLERPTLRFAWFSFIFPT